MAVLQLARVHDRQLGATREGHSSSSVAEGEGAGLDLEVGAVGTRDTELGGHVDASGDLGVPGELDILLVLDLHDVVGERVDWAADVVGAGLDELAVHDVVGVSVAAVPVDDQDGRRLDGPLEPDSDVVPQPPVPGARSRLEHDDASTVGLLEDLLALGEPVGVGALGAESGCLADLLLRHLDVVVALLPRHLLRVVDHHADLVLDRDRGLVVVERLGDHREVELAVAALGVGGRDAHRSENDSDDHRETQHLAESRDVLHADPSFKGFATGEFRSSAPLMVESARSRPSL